MIEIISIKAVNNFKNNHAYLGVVVSGDINPLQYACDPYNAKFNSYCSSLLVTCMLPLISVPAPYNVTITHAI